MRKPNYLSPSALMLYLNNPEQYYLRYLADERPPREAQTQPMSAGSAFDAYAKSYIYNRLFGHFGKNNEFEFKTIFEAQVESGNRDWALQAGKVLFDRYVEVGAMTDIMSELAKSIGEPRFEIALESVIGVEHDFAGVPVLGKPDCIFKNHDGLTVILDWKVNGYCARGNTSPMRGFLKLRGGPKHNSMHSDCVPLMYRGIVINNMYKLEELKPDWAAQLATYGWSVGVQIGGENFVAWIDQLCCGGEIRVATHRMKIGQNFQLETIDAYQKLWKAIETGWIFPNMARADNDAMCNTLDNRGLNFKDVVAGSKEDFFNEATKDTTPFWQKKG